MFGFIGGVAFTLVVLVLLAGLASRSAQSKMIVAQAESIETLQEHLVIKEKSVVSRNKSWEEMVATLEETIGILQSGADSRLQTLHKQQAIIFLLQRGRDRANEAAKLYHDRCVEAGIITNPEFDLDDSDDKTTLH